MTHYKEVSFILKCVNGHVFSLVVERKEDVIESHVTDTSGKQGWAIYRDRSLIECGYCKAYCHLMPGNATVNVDFKPEKK